LLSLLLLLKVPAAAAEGPNIAAVASAADSPVVLGPAAVADLCRSRRCSGMNAKRPSASMMAVPLHTCRKATDRQPESAVQDKSSSATENSNSKAAQRQHDGGAAAHLQERKRQTDSRMSAVQDNSSNATEASSSKAAQRQHDGGAAAHLQE
jgi:hypothetical protein